MYLQIRRMELQKTKYGNDFVIKMIGLYRDDGKFVRWIKLDNEACEIIKTLPIKISDDSLFNPLPSN